VAIDVAELFVVDGVCGGTAFFVPGVPAVLGRSPECHLQVADPWISSMHALFERRGEELWIVDLDSRNGTFVDDERVREVAIVAGSRLRFGKTSAELRVHAEPDPQAFLYLGAGAAAPLVAGGAARDVLEPALRERAAAVAVAVEGIVELAAARPPAEAAERVLALQRALLAAAVGEGAAVDARLDGTLLAVFGAVEAVPDAAERALRCAIELVLRAAKVEDAHPAPRLTVKVGVESGPALAWNFASAERPGLRAAGVSVAAAQRLAADAAPGEVLCGGEAARAAAGAFSFADRGRDVYRVRR
jgi:class 3 adenylate cyclase